MDAGDNLKNFNVLTMMTSTMTYCSNTEPDVSNQVDDNGGEDEEDHSDDAGAGERVGEAEGGEKKSFAGKITK